MIDVTFTVNNTAMHTKLSTYKVTHAIEYPRILTALDGTEYGNARRRPIMTVSFIPLTDAEASTYYNILKSSTLTVVYTDPHMNTTRTASMRLASDIEAVFGIKSITGNRYYKGGEITLRQRTVL
jgi:hypothetical protein